jgi:hypothetical protein
MGWAFVRILDLNSTSFCFSQEKFKKKDMRMVQKAMALMTEHNPSCLILLNEWIEMSLLAINILWKHVDLFCHPSLMNFIIFTFDINPAFGS